jgi:hypothetical protein
MYAHEFVVTEASLKDLRAVAQRLVLGVFEALRDDRVIPTSFL